VSNNLEGLEILSMAKSRLVQSERLLALNIQILQQLHLHVTADIVTVEAEIEKARQAV
jgi:hypothetical protein